MEEQVCQYDVQGLYRFFESMDVKLKPLPLDDKNQYLIIDRTYLRNNTNNNPLVSKKGSP